MWKSFFAVIFFLSFLFSGCLEIEETVTIKEDGSGSYEMKTAMGKLITALGKQIKEDRIIKDTVISYDPYIDTAQSLSDIEQALLRKATWNIRINTDEDLLDMTLRLNFNEPQEVNQLLQLLIRWDNTDITGNALKSLDIRGATGEMEKTTGTGNPFGDITKQYYKTEWQTGNLRNTLDSSKYRSIGDDEQLSTLRKLGELLQSGDVMENIFITTKFVLPRAAVKAEGKNLTLSEDRMVIKIKAPAAALITDPQSFEYEIEY